MTTNKASKKVMTDVSTGMFISDIPLGLYKRFKVPCQERCGDTYWVRLKELLDKEALYDDLVLGLKEKVE